MPETSSVIQTDPEILGGMSVFSDTCVPLRTLLGCLEAGDSLNEFLGTPRA
jgi:uncharacterized protein (DUF433 family)